MKKLISLALCAVMLFSLCATAAAAAYSDVSDKAWYAAGVEDVSQRGIMNGTGDGKFSPEGNLTRAMMVTILWRMNGCLPPHEVGTFEDVAPGLWYTDAVAWAAENGIVQGVGGNRFAPNDYLTREQMATIFFRWAKTQNIDLSLGDEEIAKIENASQWAKDAVNWAIEHNLLTRIPISGLPHGGSGWFFNVVSYASRAEVAVFISNLCTLMEKVNP